MRFKTMRRVAEAIALSCLVLSCGDPASSPSSVPTGDDPRSFLLTDVHLLPMDTERVIDDAAILVRDGVIEWAGPATDSPEFDGPTIDGQGDFVVPGLTDMHVHINDPAELELYLLNGVTTVANLSGRPDHLELQRRVRAGELRGPTIHTTGPTIDGDPPRNRRSVPLGDPALAEGLIGEQLDAGYEFIKIYDLIQQDAYDAATAAARARGAAVVGHIPKAIGLEGILQGHDLIAHAEEYFYTFFNDTDDRTRLAEAARLTAEADIAVCSNTGIIRSIIEQAESIETVLARPQVRYLPPRSLVSWLPENNRYLGRPAEWLERNKKMYPFLLELVGALHDAGVLLVTGSDAVIPGAVPGFSMHLEIEEMTRAGLTPYEALRTATVNPGSWIAEHLTPGDPFGIIAPGHRADLLLLAANPLEDLGALRQIRTVVVRGEWIDHADLAERAEQRAATYEQAREPYEALKQAIEADDFALAKRLLRDEQHDSATFGEQAVNALGYFYLLRKQDPETAVELFRINSEVFPESSNAWDSLGEGYAVAEMPEAAIENYRKSLALNPDNDNAARMIRELGAEP